MLEKQLFAMIGAFITIVSAIPYVINIVRGKTKPHVFSWFVWGTLGAIAFAGQVAGGAGVGAWLMGVTSAMGFLIFILSLKKGTKDIQLIDWVCIFGALIALLLWIVTKTPFLSVILITIVDVLAFFPTFRKSFLKPNQETMLTYFIASLKQLFGLMALEKYSVITALYPSYLFFANAFFVLFLLIRRKQIKK